MNFEKCFSDYLDSKEYDQAERDLFSIIRLSFAEGWHAAGGDLPQSLKEVMLPQTNELKGD